MKKIFFTLVLFFSVNAGAVTNQFFVPRATGQGSIGLSTVPWGGLYAVQINGVAPITSTAAINSRLTAAEAAIATATYQNGIATFSSATINGNIGLTGLIYSSGTGTNHFTGIVKAGAFAVGQGNATTGFRIDGTSLSGANIYGIWDWGTHTLSNNGSEVMSYRALHTVATTASNFNLTNDYGMYLGASAKTGSGVITNAYGLYVEAPTIGGTKNIAAYIDGTTVITGTLFPPQVAAAAIAARVPTAAGGTITCTDCSTPYIDCKSTGTAAGAWVISGTASHCQ